MVDDDIRCPRFGTKLAELHRTAEMLADMGCTAEMLWFLYDCQTSNPELKTLARIVSMNYKEPKT